MRIDRIGLHGTIPPARSSVPGRSRPGTTTMTSYGEASEDDNERKNAERVRNLAQRAGIPIGLALALILKYGNDPNVLDREAAKLKRGAENTGN
ncbi:hypothetical protein RFM41_14700 [Mesorhizobium sp. VK25A]|uniref:Uncharacterized protein n=1 Tax=Mesorhizobium vachelliae TaxID=3072309 RepID=A0ABU5A5U8_9HYPH|nr:MULTISPECIES: hypothetical protein [unclassified Mesorhizobium]MDX8533076.1 hypothetical protein [Mesorhizobium sp. VK25D]MDX8544995.1 hypothetical protein [Mesorhizobium sp. VK25A]